MSAAQTAKAAGAAVTKVAEMASHFHTLISMFGVFKGIPPAENAHAIVKVVSGIFGFGDEIKLEVLLTKLEKEPGYKNSREILTEFFLWHFKAESFDERALTWWYGNAFRTYLLKMGTSEGHNEGSEVTTVESKDPKTGVITRIVTTKEHHHGIDHALNFLKRMVDTIEKSGSTSRIKGYKILLKQFKAFGVPHIPGNAKGRALELSVQLEGLATKLEAESASRKAKPRSLLSRLTRWS